MKAQIEKLEHLVQKAGEDKKRDEPARNEENLQGKESNKNENRSKKKKTKSRAHKSSITSESEDSIFGHTKIKSDSSDSDSYESDYDKNFKSVRIITDIPQVEPFDPRKGMKIKSFFEEYESYCYQKFPNRKNMWIKELENMFEGRLKETYDAMLEVGAVNLKYETVKAKLIKQAAFLKKNNYHQSSRRDFDKLQLNHGESLYKYAIRLETAARIKYGDIENEDSQKRILKKFIETIPDQNKKAFYQRRSEAKRYGGHYNWEMLMQDLLDMDILAINDPSTKRVNMGMKRTPQYDSYSDALKDTMNTEEKSELLYKVNVVVEWVQKNQDLVKNFTNLPQNNPSKPYQQQYPGNSRPFCNFCRKTGHEESQCRTKHGLCHKCGGKGHMALACTTPDICTLCKSQGHRRKDCSQNKNSTRPQNQGN